MIFNKKLLIILPLIVAYGIFFLWPVYLGTSIANGLILPNSLSHKLGFCAQCSKTGTIINSAFISIITLGLWWVILGTVSIIKPEAAVFFLRPFTSKFKSKNAITFTVISLIILVLFAGAMALSYTDVLSLGFSK